MEARSRTEHGGRKKINFKIIAFLVGVFELFRVIVPQIILKKNPNEEFESVLFYGAIAKRTPTFDEYRVAVSALASEKEVLDDLLFQIHSASIICNKKFERQKTGLILSGLSIFVYFVLTVIGAQLV